MFKLFSEEDLLELGCESKDTDLCLEKKSDFGKDELLQLDREYNQKYSDHKKEEILDDAQENKPEQLPPPEKEEVVKRKIIKLNAPSSKLCYSDACFLFDHNFMHISQSTTVYHHYLVVVNLIQEAK